MFGPKIKLERDLYERLKELSQERGYSSVDEFVTHVLELAVEEVRSEDGDQQVEERLRGLGYL